MELAVGATRQVARAVASRHQTLLRSHPQNLQPRNPCQFRNLKQSQNQLRFPNRRQLPRPLLSLLLQNLLLRPNQNRLLSLPPRNQQLLRPRLRNLPQLLLNQPVQTTCLATRLLRLLRHQRLPMTCSAHPLTPLRQPRKRCLPTIFLVHPPRRRLQQHLPPMISSEPLLMLPQIPHRPPTTSSGHQPPSQKQTHPIHRFTVSLAHAL